MSEYKYFKIPLMQLVGDDYFEYGMQCAIEEFVFNFSFRNKEIAQLVDKQINTNISNLYIICSMHKIIDLNKMQIEFFEGENRLTNCEINKALDAIQNMHSNNSLKVGWV